MEKIYKIWSTNFIYAQQYKYKINYCKRHDQTSEKFVDYVTVNIVCKKFIQCCKKHPISFGEYSAKNGDVQFYYNENELGAVFLLAEINFFTNIL